MKWENAFLYLVLLSFLLCFFFVCFFLHGNNKWLWAGKVVNPVIIDVVILYFKFN